MQRKKWQFNKRVNYEDHRQMFADWVDKMGLERSGFGRFLVNVQRNVPFGRLGFLLVFCLLLSFAIIFEFHRNVDYRVGDVAQTEVLSPLSFEMTDYQTTEEKRNRAAMEVPVVFDYDPTVFERVSNGVYRGFRAMRQRIKNERFPEKGVLREDMLKDFFVHKGEFDHELGIEVPDYLFEWLASYRFSAKIENIIIKNLESWYSQKIAENVDKTVPKNQAMVVARTLSQRNMGKEFNLRRGEIVDTSFMEFFTLHLDKLRITDKDKVHLTAFARLLIYPNLTLNKQEMASRRQAARDSVPPVTISVRKNQVILNEGAIVQPTQIALLKKIASLRADKRVYLAFFILAGVFFGIIVVFFQYLRRFSLGKVKVENKDVIVMGLVTLSVVTITKFFLFLTQTAFATKFGSDLPGSVFLYSAPVAAGPMLVGLLIMSGEVVWLFTAFMSIVVGIMTEMNFALMLVTFAGGMAAARGVFGCKKRNDIYWAGVRTGVVNAIMIALVLSVTKREESDWVREVLATIPAGFFGGILSSMVTMMLIPLLESIFNYTTDVKLLELSNLNHPLLKEMIVKAPGTYHHSMMVGSMVEAAAEEIGANPLLGKVMCYYHDIGKMEHANYFIENQKQGQNPHDQISPYMSKTLLVAHVKDGVELGMAHKLGKPIIDGIIQHHGTTLISYFYNKAIDIKADDDTEVQEEDFRYPGPKPQFREAALCMLADSIEAAARSLDEPTPARLQNIVRNIVQRKFMDGQLDECNLTLKDLSRVEEAFIRILLGIYHQRIDYPKSAGGGASETPTPVVKSPFLVVNKRG